jgi:hypothetical protein
MREENWEDKQKTNSKQKQHKGSQHKLQKTIAQTPFLTTRNVTVKARSPVTMDECVRLLGEPLGAGAGVPIYMPGVMSMAKVWDTASCWGRNLSLNGPDKLATTITKTAKQAAKKATLVWEAISILPLWWCTYTDAGLLWFLASVVLYHYIWIDEAGT